MSELSLPTESTKDQDPITSGFITRLNSRRELMGKVQHSVWVQKNTLLDGELFTFKDHEMQQQIF